MNDIHVHLLCKIKSLCKAPVKVQLTIYSQSFFIPVVYDKHLYNRVVQEIYIWTEGALQSYSMQINNKWWWITQKEKKTSRKLVSKYYFGIAMNRHIFLINTCWCYLTARWTMVFQRCHFWERSCLLFKMHLLH